MALCEGVAALHGPVSCILTSYLMFERSLAICLSCHIFLVVNHQLEFCWYGQNMLLSKGLKVNLVFP